MLSFLKRFMNKSDAEKPVAAGKEMRAMSTIVSDQEQKDMRARMEQEMQDDGARARQQAEASGEKKA